MGLVLQTQRQAVEAFANHKLAKQPWPAEAVIKDDIHFTLPPKSASGIGVVLQFLGASRGIGTCSDIPGLNVAVFGLRQRWDDKHLEDLSRLASCGYAVLLWSGKVIAAQPLEILGERFIRVDPGIVDPTNPIATVELLEFVCFEHHSFEHPIHSTKEWTSIQLTRTGWLSSYIPL